MSLPSSERKEIGGGKRNFTFCPPRIIHNIQEQRGGGPASPQSICYTSHPHINQIFGIVLNRNISAAPAAPKAAVSTPANGDAACPSLSSPCDDASVAAPSPSPSPNDSSLAVPSPSPSTDDASVAAPSPSPSADDASVAAPSPSPSADDASVAAPSPSFSAGDASVSDSSPSPSADDSSVDVPSPSPFFIFVFGGHGCPQPFSLPPSTFCTVNLCAHLETQHL